MTHSCLFRRYLLLLSCLFFFAPHLRSDGSQRRRRRGGSLGRQNWREIQNSAHWWQALLLAPLFRLADVLFRSLKRKKSEDAKWASSAEMSFVVRRSVDNLEFSNKDDGDAPLGTDASLRPSPTPRPSRALATPLPGIFRARIGAKTYPRRAFYAPRQPMGALKRVARGDVSRS